MGPTGEDGRWSASGLQGTVTLEVLDKEGWFFKPRTQEFTKGADNVVIEAVKGEPLVIVVEGEGRVEQEVVFSPLDTDYYPRTTEVKLTAVPDFDWVFLRWEGDVPEGEEEKNPITVVMDGPKEIKAFFVETISVSVSVEMFHDFPQAYEQLVGAPSPEGPARLPLADPTEEWRESARENEFIVMLDRVLSRQEQVSILEAAGYRVLIPSSVWGRIWWCPWKRSSWP